MKLTQDITYDILYHIEMMYAYCLEPECRGKYNFYMLYKQSHQCDTTHIML